MTKIAPLSELALSFLAQTPAPAAPGAAPGGFPPIMLVGYVLLFVAMYFFMIAPQRKKQKEHQKMLESLGAGDEVITAGGIYGEITNKKEDRFVVRIADGTKVEIGKAFITGVVNKAGSEKK
jgi:preprotein translocase subunit YajC